VLSGLQKYSGVIGIPTLWDGQVFAFAGDVSDGLVVLVLFPEDGFNVAAGGTLVYVPDNPQESLNCLQWLLPTSYWDRIPPRMPGLDRPAPGT
jgi:hypothetical protein